MSDRTKVRPRSATAAVVSGHVVRQHGQAALSSTSPPVLRGGQYGPALATATAKPAFGRDFSRVRVHTVDQPVRLARAGATAAPATPRTPAPPPATTEDCEPWQTRMLNDHLAAARTWVDDASSKIAAYAYVAASSRHSAVHASPATAAVVVSALRDNFHTTEADHVLEIRDGFASLRTALNGEFTYECEDEGCGHQAYVRGGLAFIRRLGDIHVCPPWFRHDYFRRVATLIHERAHQYPGATDNAYSWEPSYATLSPEDAIDNAESYAIAARQIYHAGAHGPGT